MRLFIAINFNENIIDSLCQSVDRLKEAAVKGNFTRRENLHLTLVFIGETDKVEAVKSAMDKIHGMPFELTIGGADRFKRHGGDIYWVGVKENNALTDIYGELCRELIKENFTIETRPYKPHLTLGREVVLSPTFDEKEFGRSIPSLTMKVDSLSLMKSERIKGKLTYTEIYQKQL